MSQNHTTCRLFFPVESFVEVLFKIACRTFVDVNKKIVISLSCNTVDLTGAKNNFSLWVKPIYAVQQDKKQRCTFLKILVLAVKAQKMV